MGLELLAGLALVGAGAAAWRRRPTSRFGPLLFLAGLAWFVPEWNNPAIGNPALFTAGLVLGAACPPLVAHAALGYPGGRLRSRAERAAVGVAYLACVGLLGVLPALFFDPAAEGCAECPHNRPRDRRRRAGGDPSTHRAGTSTALGRGGRRPRGVAGSARLCRGAPTGACQYSCRPAHTYSQLPGPSSAAWTAVL